MSNQRANGKVAITMTTGLEDPEQVTVALLTAVGAAEQGRPTLLFMAKEAVRLGLEGVAVGTAWGGCPPISDLVKRFDAAGGRLLLCPICFNAKQLSADHVVSNADLGGTVQLWEWIGAGVPGGLLDQVQQDPAHGGAVRVGTPGRRGQRDLPVQVSRCSRAAVGL